MDHCKNLPLLVNNLLRNFHSINEKLLLTPTKASISPAQTNPVSSAFHRICDPVPSHLDSPALNSLWLIKAIYWGSKTACGILNRAFQMGIVTSLSVCSPAATPEHAAGLCLAGWLPQPPGLFQQSCSSASQFSADIISRDSSFTGAELCTSLR